MTLKISRAAFLCMKVHSVAQIKPWSGKNAIYYGQMGSPRYFWLEFYIYFVSPFFFPSFKELNSFPPLQRCIIPIFLGIINFYSAFTSFFYYYSPFCSFFPIKSPAFQIVLGFLAPVETRDKVNWRTLNLAYNFQSQYIPVPDLKKVWNVFARQLRVRRMLYEKTGEYEKDMTRHLIYGAAEIYLNNQGKPGRECLLKSICDAAEHPIHQGGIFEQVIHLILTYVWLLLLFFVSPQFIVEKFLFPF